MRITVHLPEKLGKETQRLAENEKKSVSSVVAQSIEFFINEKKRRRAGERVLRLAGNTRIADDAFDELRTGREDNDDRP
jgi:metal-responsive CopG/Arc/MetJ family transcriptional regulator